MTFAVVVIRRFNVKTAGQAQNRELRRRVELRIPPPRDVWRNFGDGATAQVVHVTARVPAASWGVLPDTLEARTKTEPGERPEAALAAGWRDTADPAPADAGRPPANTAADPMPHPLPTPEARSTPARAALVASPQPCPVCGRPMPAGRTAACSSRCRAARSRRLRVGALREGLRTLRAQVEDLPGQVDRLRQPRRRRSTRP